MMRSVLLVTESAETLRALADLFQATRAVAGLVWCPPRDVARFPDGEFHPDTLVIDEDDLPACRLTVRERWPGIHVLLMRGDGGSDAAGLTDAGARGYLYPGMPVADAAAMLVGLAELATRVAWADPARDDASHECARTT